MAQRKGWDSLSPAYQKRLTRAGISPREYESGSNLKQARGHRREERPNYVERARKSGVETVVPDFDELDPREQRQVATLWEKGFMNRGKGAVKNPSRKRGERVKRAASGEQMLARERFLAWKELHGEEMTPEEWKFFREQYNAYFSQG